MVDAYALLYRAHFAFGDRPLLTSDGRNTSAAFGLLRTLLDCLKGEQPSHVAVVFDPKGGSFRNAQYPEYKAHRPPTPEAVSYGATVVKDLLPELGLCMLEEPGFEADDLAGSLVQRYAGPYTHVVLLTPDKDYQQLLGPYTCILRPKRNGQEYERTTEHDLLAKYGLMRAEQFIDILALWGDVSDNVPGVPGIGEKTAATLISKYGSIERLRGNLGKLSPKMAERIAQSGEGLDLSRMLVTIRRDAPVPGDLEVLRVKAPQMDTATAKLSALEFSTLGKDLLGYLVAASEQAPNSAGAAFTTSGRAMHTIQDTEHSYTVIETDAQVASMVDELMRAEIIAIDTETTGLSFLDDRVIGISFSTAAHSGWYLPLEHVSLDVAGAREKVQGVLASKDKRFVGHNLKFDLLMLRGTGLEVHGALYDTMLLHYLLSPDGRHGLDLLAMQELNYQPIPIEQVVPEVKSDPQSILQVPVAELGEYAAEDADVALQLYETLWPRVEEEGLAALYLDIERPLLRVLADMEWQGIALDPSRLAELRNTLMGEQNALADRIRSAAHNETLNIDSPKQVGEFLFGQLRIAEKAKKTKSGQYNTSEVELQKYSAAHPVVRDILDYRERKKLLSTYVDALPQLVNPKTGRIHAQFNQAVAGTGRLSSSRPNMQNIPVRSAVGKGIRGAFVSAQPGGVLLSADYSQIELRLMAHMAQDEAMVEAFRHGQDIHRATAAKIFRIDPEAVTASQREHAKRANFGMVYGISAFGLSQQLNIGVSEANQFIKDYFALYPAVERYMQTSVQQARQLGYSQTLWGRKRWIPDINSTDSNQRAAAERNAINAPIQGTAADIIKKAMVDIDRHMTTAQLESKLILQVHDELIFDCPAHELERVQALVVHGMQNAARLSVPLVVDTAVGHDWGHLE